MKTNSENTAVFYDQLQWPKYVAVALLFVVAIVVTIFWPKWYYIGGAWMIVALTLFSSMDYYQYTISNDGLLVKAGNRQYEKHRGKAVSIPKANLIGIGRLSTIYPDSTVVFYRDEIGRISFIVLPWGDKVLSKFKQAFRRIHPDVFLTTNIEDEILGSKIKDVSINGKPWQLFAAGELFFSIAWIYFFIKGIMLFNWEFKILNTSFSEFIHIAWAKSPILLIGFSLWTLILMLAPFYKIYATIKETLKRINSKGVIYTIYEKGLIVWEELPIEKKFFRWDEIISIKPRKFYPGLTVSYRLSQGVKTRFSLAGFFNETDILETASYVDVSCT